MFILLAVFACAFLAALAAAGLLISAEHQASRPSGAAELNNNDMPELSQVELR